MLAVAGMIVHIYREEFPSPLIKAEAVFWLFILMVIKCLSNLFKKYFSTSMILLMCWIPAPTLIKPIFAKTKSCVVQDIMVSST